MASGPLHNEIFGDPVCRQETCRITFRSRCGWPPFDPYPVLVPETGCEGGPVAATVPSAHRARRESYGAHRPAALITPANAVWPGLPGQRTDATALPCPWGGAAPGVSSVSLQEILQLPAGLSAAAAAVFAGEQQQGECGR